MSYVMGLGAAKKKKPAARKAGRKPAARRGARTAAKPLFRITLPRSIEEAERNVEEAGRAVESALEKVARLSKQYGPKTALCMTYGPKAPEIAKKIEERKKAKVNEQVVARAVVQKCMTASGLGDCSCGNCSCSLGAIETCPRVVMGDLADLAGFKEFLAKAKKALNPAKLLKTIKGASGFLKTLGTVVKVAGGVISAIYPPAAVIIGPATAIISKITDKAQAAAAIAKKGAEIVKGGKAAQAALARVIAKTQAAVQAQVAAGKPAPAEVVIEPSAVQKEMEGKPLETVQEATAAPEAPKEGQEAKSAQEMELTLQLHRKVEA